MGTVGRQDVASDGVLRGGVKGWLAILAWQVPRLGRGVTRRVETLLFSPLSSKHELKMRIPVVQVREKTLF